MNSSNDSRYLLFSWLDPSDQASWLEASRSPVRPSHTGVLGYAIDAQGNLLRPDVDTDQAGRLRSQGTRWLPVVSDRDGSGQVAASLLRDKAAQRRALTALRDLASEAGVDGICLRFIGAFPAQRDDFSDFVEELAWELHQLERLLVVVAYPQVRDPELEHTPDPQQDPGGWLQARADSFDYRALSAYADLFIAETRDYARSPSIVTGGAGDRPELRYGPAVTTPVGWLQSVIEHAMMHVPPRRFAVTVPLYGKEWIGDGQVPRVVPMAALASRLEAAGCLEETADPSGDRRIVFTGAGGQQRMIIIDSYQSLRDKAALVKRYDLGGVAAWRLGFGTGEAWRNLRKALEE